MSNTSYEAMNLKQLLKAQHDIATAMARKVEQAEKAAPTLEAEAVTLINRLVTKQGLPPAKTAVAVTFPPQNGNGNGNHKAKAKGRKRHKVAIKYRDPAGNTWTGRGRAPRWLVAAEKQGAKRENFKVA